MEGQDQGQSTAKPHMPCLMVANVHSQDPTDGTADRSNAKEDRLGDPPFLFNGSLLVDVHKQEGRNINYKQVNKKRHRVTTFLGGMILKRVLWISLLFLFVLAGCGAKETFETVEDEMAAPTAAPMGQLSMALPESATMSVMDNGAGDRLYLCDGYTIAVRTMASGDLEKTLYETTGFSKEQLKLIQTNHHGADRYDLVWSAAGEGGDQVCRATILDDGNYHYVVTIMAPGETAGEFTENWQSILSSLSINQTG